MAAEAHEGGALGDHERMFACKSRRRRVHTFADEPPTSSPKLLSWLRIYEAAVENEGTPSGRSRPGERQTRPCSVGGFHTGEEAGSPTFLATPLGRAAQQASLEKPAALERTYGKVGLGAALGAHSVPKRPRTA